MVRNVMLSVYILKTPLPGQMMHEITFATVHATDADVRFCEGSKMLVSKTA